jgi:predicted amidohydrolase YtcJ
MRRLNVIPNIQPSFVPTDMRWVKDRLSAQKQHYAYAWKTLLLAGLVVAGGSDAPIESCSPMMGLFDSMFREAREAGEDGKKEIYRPEESLTFSEALWIYTVGAAVASQSETYLGKLEDGYLADFVVIDPIVLSNPRLLKTIKPLLSVVGGIIVFDANSTSSTDILTEQILCTEGPFSPGKNGSRPGGGWAGAACKCCRTRR